MGKKESEEALFGTPVSSADSNRFYSILLDARASAMSENLYDVAERLLGSEKENAKISLEQLWALRKKMEGEASAGTVDLLIEFYQNKINVLRAKEDRIKAVSKDSRKLLEEKRMKDSEVATVKQSIDDCISGIEEMKAKLEKLNVREQELTLIGTQLARELRTNENEIVNGLYEIILAQQQSFDGQEIPADDLQPELPAAAAVDDSGENPPVEESRAEPEAPLPRDETADGGEDYYQVILDKIKGREETESPDGARAAVSMPFPEQKPEETPPLPKSVVKTTRGKIIAEYYYDAGAYKNERHYILNSKFVLAHLRKGITRLKTESDQGVYSDLVQTVQDAYKRISENDNLHFEVSTNEILNAGALKELWGQLKTRSYEEIERFCVRLRAKLDALGNNYAVLLKEQMERLISP